MSLHLLLVKSSMITTVVPKVSTCIIVPLRSIEKPIYFEVIRWIRTADIWHQKRLLWRLCHCRNCSNFDFILFLVKTWNLTHSFFRSFGDSSMSSSASCFSYLNSSEKSDALKWNWMHSSADTRKYFKHVGLDSLDYKLVKHTSGQNIRGDITVLKGALLLL